MYKNNTKKILVCLPVYNEAKLLKRAVNSILEQTYSNFSLVIVNDGSTDNSLEEANKFLYDSRVSIVNNKKNSGCFYSKNNGIRFMESGNFDIYTTHDADDFSEPTRFEEVVKTFDSDKVLAVQDTELRFGKPVPSWYTPPNTPMVNLAHGFFSKKAFQILGYFDNIGYSADEDYWFRLHAYCSINKDYTMKTIEKILYHAEVTDDNMILRYGDELREIYRKRFRSEIENMKVTNNFYRNFFNEEEIEVHA